jgi:hypothetical protein
MSRQGENNSLIKRLSKKRHLQHRQKNKQYTDYEKQGNNEI